jgi:hypothetical protein
VTSPNAPNPSVAVKPVFEPIPAAADVFVFALVLGVESSAVTFTPGLIALRSKYSEVLKSASSSPRLKEGFLTWPERPWPSDVRDGFDKSGGADMMSSPVYVAEGESECDGVADDGGVGFLRTGRSQAGEGRPVPSGTRGESTGMLQTGLR